MKCLLQGLTTGRQMLLGREIPGLLGYASERSLRAVETCSRAASICRARSHPGKHTEWQESKLSSSSDSATSYHAEEALRILQATAKRTQVLKPEAAQSSDPHP